MYWYKFYIQITQNLCAEWIISLWWGSNDFKNCTLLLTDHKIINFFVPFALWIFMFKTCINAQFMAIPTSSSYHLFLTDSDEISVMLCLSYSASDGIFFPGNLITECAVVVSDGTFNQKGNQKVIHLWVFLQKSFAKLYSIYYNSRSELLALNAYVTIDNNVIHISQHLSLLPGMGCRLEISSVQVLNQTFPFTLVLDLAWQFRTPWHLVQVISKNAFGCY